MSKIDTSSRKEFKLDDIFEKIPVKKIQGKAGDFPTEPDNEHDTPLLTAGAVNQGFARYARKEQCPSILKNVITVSANGANTGVTFYQDKPFAILQDAYAIKIKNMEIPSKEVGLFLASSINKTLHGNYNWSNKAGWNNIKNEKIKLPFKTEEVIDWKYMENFIQELERERIQELEKERVQELRAYLKATGLNDYTLTDEDKEVLIKFIGHDGVTKRDVWNLLSGITPPRGKIDEKLLTKKFKVSDLFESQNGDTDIQKSDINNAGEIVVTSGVENYGIAGMSDIPARIFNKNTITADMFGNAFYRDTTYKMVTHARVFSLKLRDDSKMNQKVGMFLVSKMSWLDKIFSYDKMCTFEKIKDFQIELPVTPSGDPDYELMAKFITAIEKLVIKNIAEKIQHVQQCMLSIVEN